MKSYSNDAEEQSHSLRIRASKPVKEHAKNNWRLIVLILIYRLLFDEVLLKRRWRAITLLTYART